jgi:hypothetical protein
MNLVPAITSPFFKCGFFGPTGSGKTWTASKVMAQFIAKFFKGSQLAMFDTEPAAGFVAPMVKEITGKELIVCSSRSFSDLMDFTQECIDKKYVALADSITHPWRTLCSDFLEAKKSRVNGAGGRTETTKLSLKDWGPIKEIWNQFSEKYVFSPVHFCICGREGDMWDMVTDEEGNEEMRKTGVKMKTEGEFGHEPSLLVQMRIADTTTEKTKTGHFAYVTKDRSDQLTGLISGNNPDIEFFMPHILKLNIGGVNVTKSDGKKIFNAGTGPNWETIRARRKAILESIKDDLVLSFPGRTTEENKGKVEALRAAFGTSAWTELEEDEKKWPLESLESGREKMQTFLKEKK